ncbi:MAG: GHKL domain-containing protein [Nitrospirae bacterium]|nr:GHKL domain-containing protein [Nitrospirota bacterium]
MTLRKKITLGFVLSSSIIAFLVLFGYLNFIEIRKEIRFLELSDSIRSKTLQLRRHEKNYFLYRNPKELEAVYVYLKGINALLRESDSSGSGRKLQAMKATIDKYEQRFNRIENIVAELWHELSEINKSRRQNPIFLWLIEGASLESPLISAEALQKLYSLPDNHSTIKNLNALDIEISILRKLGEEMIDFSKEFDKTARTKANRAVYLSQAMMLFALPLFLLIGLGISLMISRGIIRRMSILTKAVEEASEGNFTYISGFGKLKGKDEVDVLIQRFNYMEERLQEKEKDLLESKKLVAIGALASGVAHEINNPLSNIYTTAQRLKKKAGDEYPPFIVKGLDDIFDQTVRVKSIVGELLEFARSREPQSRKIELNELIRSAYSQISDVVGLERVRFSLESFSDKIDISVDPEQMERVFINLFKNAVEAMSGEGSLTASMQPDHKLNTLIIRIADTGKGMSQETIEKIFEPFFTTKDKGTGLGLAIVYNIIRKHGGNIQVKSAEGKGTTFVITLPLKEE